MRRGARRVFFSHSWETNISSTTCSRCLPHNTHWDLCSDSIMCLIFNQECEYSILIHQFRSHTSCVFKFIQTLSLVSNFVISVHTHESTSHLFKLTFWCNQHRTPCSRFPFIRMRYWTLMQKYLHLLWLTLSLRTSGLKQTERLTHTLPDTAWVRAKWQCYATRWKSVQS